MSDLAAANGTAQALVQAIADRDQAALRAVLTDDVELQALLPRGYVVWDGPEAVASAFDGWFGSLAAFELIAATAGEIGTRLHLRWRFRARHEEGPLCLVEQQLYADAAEDGRLGRIRLLCSGFCPEPSGAGDPERRSGSVASSRSPRP